MHRHNRTLVIVDAQSCCQGEHVQQVFQILKVQSVCWEEQQGIISILENGAGKVCVNRVPYTAGMLDQLLENIGNYEEQVWRQWVALP